MIIDSFRDLLEHSVNSVGAIHSPTAFLYPQGIHKISHLAELTRSTTLDAGSGRHRTNLHVSDSHVIHKVLPKQASLSRHLEFRCISSRHRKSHTHNDKEAGDCQLLPKPSCMDMQGRKRQCNGVAWCSYVKPCKDI